MGGVYIPYICTYFVCISDMGIRSESGFPTGIRLPWFLIKTQIKNVCIHQVLLNWFGHIWRKVIMKLYLVTCVFI